MLTGNNLNAEKNDVIDFNHYWKILKRRKWNVIVAIAISIVCAIFYLSKATPIYEASSTIQADPVQPNASAQDQYVMNSMVFLFYETQYEIISSRKVAERVVDKLNLVEKYKIENKLNNENEEGSLLGSTIDWFKGIFQSQEQNKSSTNQLTDEQIKTLIAKSIQSNLNVSGGTQSQIIDIKFQSEDPVLASDIVNSISEAYIEFGLESRLSQIQDTAEWLSEQLNDLRKNLQKSEDALRDFRLSQNLMDTEQQQRITNTQLSTLNTELVKAQTDVSQWEELQSQVTSYENGAADIRTLGPVLQSSTVRELVREESILSRKVKELSERYGEKHPKMVAARSDLTSAQLTIENEVNKIVENIKKEYKSAKAQEANIKRLINEKHNELQSYQGDSFELTRLEREVENNRRIYESFLGRLMEADVSGDYDASNIRVIDKATVPEYPVKPRGSLVILFALFLGSICGMLIALAKELLGNVFRTPDQLEKELNVSSLGITPLVLKKDTQPELQYIVDQRSNFSEAINTIRTGILFSNIDNPPRTTLITSTHGSEGKTTLSINLAVALSQLDKTVLLELDLRKPVIAKDLAIKNQPGIVDYFADKSIADIVQKIDTVPQLDVLVCGKIPVNPTELISSNKFSEFLGELKGIYKYIVIDSPPTLPVTDSCVLSKYADATVMAVKAEDTKITTVKESINRLRKVNANLTGVVLTQASKQKLSYYGEHYYQDDYYGVTENK